MAGHLIRTDFNSAACNKAATRSLAALMITGMLSGCAAATIGQTPLPLNEGEKDLVENIFDSGIDTTQIRKYLNDEDNQCRAAIAYGARDIVFYKNYHSDDYSDKTEPYDLGLFVHEVTHLWQAQNWSLFEQFRKHCNSYNYEITAGSRFDDFCNEQQAAMLQDYARYYLTAAPVYPTRLENNDDPQALPRLKALIENHFPAITAERLRTENRYPDTLATRQNIEAHRRENNIRTVTRSKCG